MKKIFIGIVALCVLIIGMWMVAPSPWNTMCPGIQTNDLLTMDKRLSKKMSRIIETLDEEGFTYSISSVYRSPEKQQCYHEISKVIKKYTGQNGLTQTSRSCHNNTRNGTPSSLAIDLHKLNGSMNDKVAFYTRLRELARQEGLTSGGDFKHSNPVWAKYDLGWDPGHIQVRNCKNTLSLN